MHLLDLLPLAAAASASVLDRRQQTNAGDCATGVHVIAAGGGNSPDPTAIGRLGTLANLVVSRIPGSDFISLPYNKQEIGPQKLPPDSIPNGIQTAGQYVQQYTASCPNSKIVILGYSSGAVITMEALRTGVIPQNLARNTIIANIAYGEQTFVPGQPYDRGTCQNGYGTQPTDNPAALGNYIPISQSYSDINDPQSCSGPPEDYQIHLSYPGKYDQAAAQFVVQQFNSLGGGNGGGSSSSSSSSSSAAAFPSASSSSSGGLGLGGGFGSATSSASASATSASLSSASASASSAIASATSSASSAASAASSSAAVIGGGATSAAASAASAPAVAASSAVESAPAAATSLTPYNPDNGQATLAPSSGLISAACVGVLMVLGIALH